MSIYVKIAVCALSLLLLTACGMGVNRTDNPSLHRAVASPMAGKTTAEQEAPAQQVPVNQALEPVAFTEAIQTNQTNLTVPADNLWVADQEELLKRLQLVQQDGQKVYEAFSANASAWATWWDILEIDWQALGLAAQQSGAIFKSPSKVVQTNLDRAKILQDLTTTQNLLEEMANTLSVGQSLTSKQWQKLGSAFATLAYQLYQRPSTTGSMRYVPLNAAATVQTNQNLDAVEPAVQEESEGDENIPASDNGPSEEETAEDLPLGQTVTPMKVPVRTSSAEEPAGALSLVGFAH